MIRATREKTVLMEQMIGWLVGRGFGWLVGWLPYADLDMFHCMINHGKNSGTSTTQSTVQLITG